MNCGGCQGENRDQPRGVGWGGWEGWGGGRGGGIVNTIYCPPTSGIPRVQEHGILPCAAGRARFWLDGRPPLKCLCPAHVTEQALEAARQGQGEKPKRHHFHKLHNVSEVVEGKAAGLRRRPNRCKHPLWLQQDLYTDQWQGGQVCQEFH